ncbi:MAG: pilus assembly protein TadG-related protein [Planctomycetota bacterium]|nr:pilus assembly protein TadG-related protein [Planctomycetota bacterium]
MRPTNATTRPTRGRAHQEGAVLVMVALLLVGIFGLLGAVVDGGRLRITRQQMDAGAEAAALEGLRFKDQDGDSGRRDRAIRSLALQWDDDLDPDNGDRFGLGAGTLPVVTGDTPLGGVLQADPAIPGGYKPAVERNPANVRNGDLVAGQYLPGGSGSETDAFVRDDFEAAAAGGVPQVLADAPAFLVRLRRATNRLALDRQPGVSSAGPPFEWLWARGSAWREPGVGESGQSRSDGLTIRATSIASAERALVVSDDPAASTRLAPFALLGGVTDAWAGTEPGSALVLETDAAGFLTLGDSEQGVWLTGRASRVAIALTPGGGIGTIEDGAELLIVPVYQSQGELRLVAGFTLATATLSGVTLNVVRVAGRVLAVGASTASPSALDSRLALAQDPPLLALHRSFPEPVLAPVLRR